MRFLIIYWKWAEDDTYPDGCNLFDYRIYNLGKRKKNKHMHGEGITKLQNQELNFDQ